jgi:hypothetical protein
MLVSFVGGMMRFLDESPLAPVDVGKDDISFQARVHARHVQPVGEGKGLSENARPADDENVARIAGQSQGVRQVLGDGNAERRAARGRGFVSAAPGERTIG